MKFTHEKDAITDERMKPFIHAEEIWKYINNAKATQESVRAFNKKLLSKKRLTLLVL